MDSIKRYTYMIETKIDTVLANPYIMATLKVILTLYAVQLAPKLPNQVKTWFDNTYVKILGIMALAYLSSKDFQLAVLLAIVLVLGTNIASGRQVLESFSSYDNTYKPASTQALIEPKTAVFPGCSNVTLTDIQLAFNNDMQKMQQGVEFAYYDLLQKMKDKTSQQRLEAIARAVGLPYNIQFSNETAPYIATLLMYYGFKFTDDCQPPN